MTLKPQNVGFRMITYRILEKYPEIVQFCTTRDGGVSQNNFSSLNLSPFSGDNPVHFEQNKQILCENYGINPDKLIIPFQTHGTEIREINETYFHLSIEEKTKFLSGVDALVTNIPGVCIGVTTADCVPLQFYDPEKKVIGVAHAGWRGTCGRISEKTIKKMIDSYNCSPEDILVTIGPSISVIAYEVGIELIENFRKAGFESSEIFESHDNKIHLDLWQANLISLEKCGIFPENIEISGKCTYTEHDKFFSARRLGIKSGRLLTGIMLRPPKSPDGDFRIVNSNQDILLL